MEKSESKVSFVILHDDPNIARGVVEKRLKYVDKFVKEHLFKDVPINPPYVVLDDSAYHALGELTGGNIGFSLYVACQVILKNDPEIVRAGLEGKLPVVITGQQIRESGITRKQYEFSHSMGHPAVIRQNPDHTLSPGSISDLDYLRSEKDKTEGRNP